MSIITIIGSGGMAAAIGSLAANAGHTVEVMSRDVAKARALAEQIGTGATTGTFSAAPAGDIVVLAVPYSAVLDVVKQYGEGFADKLLVDITNPVKSDFSGSVTPEDSFGAQEIAKASPASVVIIKAFNTLFSHVLAAGPTRPDAHRPGQERRRHIRHRPARRHWLRHRIKKPVAKIGETDIKPKEGSKMLGNEEIVRELYAAGEGQGTDIEKFVSMFSEDGYMLDIPSGTKFRGQAIGESIAGFVRAFPDAHREVISIYGVDDVVVAELAIRGTHRGDLALPTGTLAPTGKAIDVPSCDVFHLKNGKVTSFHCYNMPSVMLQQLGVG
jgi:ketosteroid isomerase-like protein